MTLFVDMEKLLKFCPFPGATASVTCDGAEVVVAFEWRKAAGEFARLVSILNIFQMNQSIIGIDKFLDLELHRMRHEMEIMRNIDQPV